MSRGRKGSRPGPMKGFRPGKEPPQLRKQRVKEQLGETTRAQQQLIDAFAGRSPEEVRRMMARWRTGSLAAASALAVAALILLLWSWVAALVVGAIAVLVFVLWFRLEKQRASLEALADMVGRSGRR